MFERASADPTLGKKIMKDIIYILGDFIGIRKELSQIFEKTELLK